MADGNIFDECRRCIVYTRSSVMYLYRSLLVVLRQAHARLFLGISVCMRVYNLFYSIQYDILINVIYIHSLYMYVQVRISSGKYSIVTRTTYIRVRVNGTPTRVLNIKLRIDSVRVQKFAKNSRNGYSENIFVFYIEC